MDAKLIVSASPHVRAPESTRSLMGNVIIALAPCVVASAIIFGWRALLLTAVTVASCVGFEWLYCKLMKKPIPVGDLSAVVTGLILAMNFPVSLPIGEAIVGAFIAIVLVKQLFGGIGMNFANPALVGRIALFSGFSSAMTNWVYPDAAVDQLSSATPLQVADPSRLSLLDLFMGVHGGVMGETCALAILIGFVYLVVTKTISPAIPVTYLATVAVMSLLAGRDPMVQLLSGGLLFGAVFMATDYVTSPVTKKGEVIFGIGCGLLTVFIRYFGGYPEGVSYSILIMNCCVWLIDKIGKPNRYGVTKEMKAAAKAAKKAGKEG